MKKMILGILIFLSISVLAFADGFTRKMLDDTFDDKGKSQQHYHQKNNKDPQDDPGDFQAFLAIEFHLKTPFQLKKPEPFLQ